MLEVFSAVTGESIAVFEDEEIADASVKALKTALGAEDWSPAIPTTAPPRTIAHWTMMKPLQCKLYS